MPSSLLRPPPLVAGDRIAVIAPSGHFSRVRFERGVATLRSRYDVQLGEHVEARDGYLAGTDAQRAADLLTALRDTSVKAIVAARGGFGATRLLDEVQPEQVAASPKWLVGFSDITALHAVWARAGYASLHGAMVCSLPESGADVQRRWFDLLESEPTAALQGEGWCGQQARGRLMGGNLAVLSALCGTPYRPALRGAVLLLEDIGERPYRIDRMLTTLGQAGLLTGLAGVALGQFSQCEPGDDGTDAETVLRRHLLPLGIPVVADLPIGHVPDNQPVVLGDVVSLDAQRGRLSAT